MNESTDAYTSTLKLVVPCGRAAAEDRLQRSAEAVGHVSEVDADSGVATVFVGRVVRYAIVTATVGASDQLSTTFTLNASGFGKRGRGARRANRRIAGATLHVDERWYLLRRRVADVINLAALAVAGCALVVAIVFLVVHGLQTGAASP